MRCARRADEIRVVRVGEAVRARFRRADDGAFLQQEDRVARSGRREEVGDRLGALRIGDGVAPAVEDAQAQPVATCELDEKLGAGEPGRTNLEVGRARATDRSASHQRAPQVGVPAARPPDDSAWRPLERRAADVEDARVVQDPHCVGPSLDVQLVPGRSGERALLICAQLGAHADVAEQPERAPGYGGLAHVEVQRDLASAVDVEPPGEWKSPESSASRSQSDAGTTRASSRLRSSESDILECQQTLLVGAPQ
jgi:hypothetical protein